MSFRLDLQSAPVRRGTVGTPSAWAGGGGGSDPTPTMSGTYLGRLPLTLTFTVISGGIIGTTETITLSVSDALGTWYLNLGTAHGYAAGTAVIVGEPAVYAAFAAGTFAAGRYFTVALSPANALRYDHQIIVADSIPVDIAPTGFSRNVADLSHVSYDLRETITELGIGRDVGISVDWLDGANADRASYMESERHLVTLGEDYDETTVLLWRGVRGDPDSSSCLPFVGPAGTFARASIGSFVHPRTGRITHAASGVPRFPAGQHVAATAVDGGTTNVLTRSCAKSGTLYFAASDADTTVAWDTNVLPPIDPDDTNCPADFRTGTLRISFASTATALTDNANGTDETVVAATTYTASIWLRGHGTVRFLFRAGAATPTNTRGTVTVTLTETWTRYTCTGATVGGEVVGDLAITPETSAVMAAAWAFGWQLEPKAAVTDLVYTNGATAARAAETLSFPVPIPGYEGTVSFWVYWGGDDGSSTYPLIYGSGVTGAQAFIVFYNSGSSLVGIFTNTAGGSSMAATKDLAAGQWYHIAVTWAGSGANLNRAVYVRDAATATLATNTDATTNWEPSFGTGISIATGTGVTNVATRFQELRVDGEAKSSADVLDMFNRLVLDEWKAVGQRTGGRHLRIQDVQEIWRDTANPDDVLMVAKLTEANREDDSVWVVT